MARPAQHHPAAIIAAALALASNGEIDGVTIGAVSRTSGAPSGSIYHRFGSRDGLLAAAWLDATRSFNSGFLEALDRVSQPPGLAAALFTVEWSRREPHRARALVLHRAMDFGAARWSNDRRAEARYAAAGLEQGLTEFSTMSFGASGGEVRRRVTFALLDVPLAAVRRYLAAGMTAPPEVDGYVDAAVRALLGPNAA
ncbi:MAG: hypothetical protein QOK05_1217 [Chloroflexota bacterium]|jgi:AcrR family transcriptional regulator|nr:hypothetical protein [Chloroflexota bacterium]